MNYKKRTHNCGELRSVNIGQKVTLNGWVKNRRDLGNLIFIWLRDRYGITQIVFEPNKHPEAHSLGKELRSEYVISVTGTVIARPLGAENKNLPTGEIDVEVEDLIILNKAETTPFVIDDKTDASEELKLKYRYLDLRRDELKNAMVLRHKMAITTRKYLDELNFVEIETPYLMKSTPEGARDFLVPSRIHKGKFYALPQSPQIFKQLLMVAGFDRYFQLVKCFRDEDFRADRQPEFTQIDIEMSFIDEEDIYSMVEGLMFKIYKELLNFEIPLPFKRLSYYEAAEKYGSDKPDLRYSLEMKTLNEGLVNSEFKLFKENASENNIITAIVAPNCAVYSRSQIDNLTEFVKNLGAGGLLWYKVSDNNLEGPTVKFISTDESNFIISKTEAKNGDLILIIAGKKKTSLEIMGTLRKELAKRLELYNANTPPAILWVTDFPLFEWDEDTERFYAMHHPFTSPNNEDISKMETNPGDVKARAYDLVLNGYEIAGGSIRIFDSILQQKMFNALGISEKEANEKFGFLLEAFKYGAPPHGGIAFGFDRMAMILSGKDSIRDVIAFPKTTSALSLMEDSPSFVDNKQLDELGIKIIDKSTK